MGELADDIRDNEALWAEWQAHGVTEGTELKVEFHFYAARTAAGEDLEKRLRSAGFAVQSRTTRTLWVLKGLSVTASEQGAWTLERLNRRVEEMLLLATECGVLFDGCGAEMP